MPNLMLALAAPAMNQLARKNWRGKLYFELGPTIITSGSWLFQRGGMLGYALRENVELLSKVMPVTNTKAYESLSNELASDLLKSYPGTDATFSNWYDRPTLGSFDLKIPSLPQGIPKRWTKRITPEESLSIMSDAFIRGSVAGRNQPHEFRLAWESQYGPKDPDHWQFAYEAGIVDASSQTVLAFDTEVKELLMSIVEWAEDDPQESGFSSGDTASLRQVSETIIASDQDSSNSNPTTTETEETNQEETDKAGEMLGTDILGGVADAAYDLLAPGEIEDVYRASLIGGLNGALMILNLDERLASMWRAEERKTHMASRLLEVWTWTVATLLLSKDADQELMAESTALGLARVVFESDESSAIAESKAYQAQLKHDETIRRSGGLPLYSQTIFYWRCINALGGNIDFGSMPIPVTDIGELIAGGLINPVDNGTPGTILEILPIIAESVKMARATYDQITA